MRQGGDKDMSARRCLDCDAPGERALVDERGTMHGYVCLPCDTKRRHRAMGWRRRITVRLRRAI
jgi:hypothetical protein